VFSLSKQVGGTHLRVNGVVSDDQRFGWTGKKVNANPSEQESLGFGNKGIARTNNEVHSLHKLGADGHRSHSLNATEQIDFVSPSEMHRRHGLSRNPPVDRRRHRGHSLHPGHLGCEHRHVRAGHHRFGQT